MKFNLILFIASIGWLTACNSSEKNTETEVQPNFVFILADDLGWTDLGCYGSTFYETPNLDRLAATGMRFTQGYAACPVCSPTRSSILTGKYPARTDNTDWFGAPQPDEAEKHWTKDKPLLPAAYNEKMDLDEKTIAETMKEAGYQTFFAGKWHLGPTEEYWPEHQGFDVNKGGGDRGSPYTPGRYFSPYGNPRLEDGPEGEHLPDRLAQETVDFIEAHQKEPFFTYLSFYSVHTPLMTRADLEAKYQQKKEELGLEDEWGTEGEREVRLVQCHPVYAGMVEAMDQAVGKVLDKLDELGLAENTIIFFMSDNGGLSTSEGHPTSNLPLRAGKGWLYEGGIREPWMVRWPGVTTAGSTTDVPVISTDFYPTILEMAGLPPQKEQHQDGVSFVPALKNEGSFDRGTIYWHYPHYGNQGGSPGAAIREGSWKLIHWFEDDRIELYNLARDVEEKDNLADLETDKVEELQKKLNTWMEGVNAKMPSPNPAHKTDNNTAG